MNNPLIRDYDPAWPHQFQEISALLIDTLGDAILRIEHVGSTAVPGLSAKPIIDLDIVYARTAGLSVIEERLKSIGYYHAGDQGIAEREVFKRKPGREEHPVLDRMVHHLYACPEDGVELGRHLAFRDYLRGNAGRRDAYAVLKRDIAAAADQDRKRYAVLKEVAARTFVAETLVAAQNERL